MDKVRCPWCGMEMELDQTFKSMTMPGTSVMFWYSCDVCGAEAPKCNSKGAAIAAAMQRHVEPLKPLTLDEVKELNGCPVWCEDRNGSGAWALVDNGEDECFDADYGDWEFCYYGWTDELGWRAWTRKPTDEERKAVAWKDD